MTKKGISEPVETMWGLRDQEFITCTCPDDAIRDTIDGCYPDDVRDIGNVTVYEYKRKELSMKGLRFLEWMLEEIDELYGNPEGEPTAPTDSVKKSAENLLSEVAKDYQVWALEETGNTKTVNAFEWCKEHEPEWIKEQPNDR